MKIKFQENEINHNTLKFLVGVIVLVLASWTSFLSDGPIDSISASYHEGGFARDFFVGFLFAVSAFMVAYNGLSTTEMVLAKLGAVAVIGVAIFPCACGHCPDANPLECSNCPKIIPHVHYISAALMFFILAWYCLIFYKRAMAKKTKEATWRAYIYLICGVVISLSMIVLAIDFLTNESISSLEERLVFYCEAAGLIAFGISWLVASKALPIITAPGERTKFFN